MLEEENHNNSYQSILSSTNSNNASSSSKAVLAALRALQDKIRRLEIERSQALDEVNSLKHQLKNSEIELEHTKQKDFLLSQKNLSESKVMYEKLLTEKNDLELKIIRYEEKNSGLVKSSEELHKKIHQLEDEKHSSLLKVKDLEHQQQQLELLIKNSQRKEKGNSNSGYSCCFNC